MGLAELSIEPSLVAHIIPVSQHAGVRRAHQVKLNVAYDPARPQDASWQPLNLDPFRAGMERAWKSLPFDVWPANTT